MSEVKWIKLNTHMFDDEKIRLIEQMPDADTILVVWIKLLAQAGKTNASGYLYLNEKIPYTEEMLSTIFNRPLNTVRMALQTFKQFGMIEIDEDSYICITNWEKHQNVKGLEKIKEDTRKRVQRHRDNKRLEDGNAKCNVTVTQSNATEEEEEQKKNKKEIKTKYAEFVTMKDNEYQKLIDDHGEQLTKKMIETLDNYKGAKGKRYKSDYRAILSWVKDKVLSETTSPKRKQKPTMLF